MSPGQVERWAASAARGAQGTATVRFSGLTIVDSSELSCYPAGPWRVTTPEGAGSGRKSPQTGCWGKKVLAVSPRICEGEKIWNPKVESFFLSLWKKLLIMNGTSGAGARGGQRRKGTKQKQEEKGEERGGLWVSRSEQTREEGGREGGGVRRVT
ncbi:hypothetical protein GW7_21739 [Heterocephalus glaber]|uniref:Uncharacterized protein n=1 Tax=Heterocephalus glaber TaxID=10181 RepID=G5C4M1_HETGA|nr:hypothetical protein GW7_21739 [Heterocephalus glaber]